MFSRQLLIGLVSVVALCQSASALADEAPATPAVPAETVPAAPVETAAAAPVAAPSPETATVIFFRPSRFVGAGVGFIVREGQTELGKLRNGKYFTVHVTAGKHDFVVHSESKDVLTIDADPGETYYVQGSVGIGLMVGRPNLAPADQAAFEAVKAKLKEVPPLSEKD